MDEIKIGAIVKDAIREAFLSNTFHLNNGSSDLSEIKSDIKAMNKTLENGEEKFKKVESSLTTLVDISQKQEIQIQLLGQTQKNYKESRKSVIAISIAMIALIGPTIWGIIQELIKGVIR